MLPRGGLAAGRGFVAGALRASAPLSLSPVLPSPASWLRPVRASTAGSSRMGLGVLSYGGAVLFGCLNASPILLPPRSLPRLKSDWCGGGLLSLLGKGCLQRNTPTNVCVAVRIPSTEPLAAAIYGAGNLFGVAPKRRGYPITNADRLSRSAYAYASLCKLWSNLC